MTPIVLFLLMLLAHIIEDFHLQGRMADMKQRRWWEDAIWSSVQHLTFMEDRNAEFRRQIGQYRYDYLSVLILHGFEWAICVSIPVFFYTGFEPSAAYMIAMIIMAFAHSLVDHLKCNMFEINLVYDQAIHIAQVVALWAMALVI